MDDVHCVQCVPHPLVFHFGSLQQSIKKFYYLNKIIVSFKQPDPKRCSLHIYSLNNIYSLRQCFIVCLSFYNSHRHTSLFFPVFLHPGTQKKSYVRRNFSDRFCKISAFQDDICISFCCKGFMDLWARIYYPDIYIFHALAFFFGISLIWRKSIFTVIFRDIWNPFEHNIHNRFTDSHLSISICWTYFDES